LTDSIAFTSIQDPNEPNISQYLWDFNGEGSAALKDPKFYFPTAGIKKIRFSVKSVAGCWSDVIEKSVEVFNAPAVDFTSTIPSCFSVATQFADLSVATGQTISSWNWNFGDSTSTSNSSTLKNPTHTFSKVGTYNVKLTALTDAGCVNSIIKQVVVYQNPVVDFLMPDICLNDASALFTNKTTIADSSALTYLWDFGDNVTDVIQSTKQNPVHKYNASGVYNVKLKVSSKAGCIVEKIKAFTVNGSVPLAKFTVQNETSLFCNVPVVFEDYSAVDFGGITKIEWYYDDALPTTVEVDNTPALRSAPAKLYKHSYPVFYSPTQKTVKVKMIAYSGLTCKATFEKVITLLAIPKVDFSLPNGCLTNGNAQFNDKTTFNGAESTLTYLWDFGDSGSGANNSSNLKNPIHIYNAVGNYQVKLTVKSLSGATSEIIKTFTVSGSIPTVSFEVLDKDFLCSNKTVNFKNNSSILFGNITKLETIYEYSVAGNNIVSIDDTPLVGEIYTHQYPASAVDLNYQVVFRVYSGICYQESTPITITINGSPNLVFDEIKPVCANVPKFLLSTAKETSGIKGTATFVGKGVVGNYFDPTIANVGSHLITYTFTSIKGCVSQKTQTIVVNPIPVITFDSSSVAINILLAGEKKLNPTVIGNDLKYKWTPSIGLSADSILNPIASPKETTKYTLTVTSKEGCVAAAELTAIVHIDPFIPNAFSPNGDGINDTWSIKYLETFVNATIKIFNRYGQEVFYAKQYNYPWDGRLKNADMPVGVYYYIIEPNNGRNRYTGSLTLLR
jgi:gliding motility-associated-like protein